MAAKMSQTFNNTPDPWQYRHLSDSVKYKKWILNNIISRSGFQKICVFILENGFLFSAQLRLNAMENSRTQRPCEYMNSCTARHNCFLMHSWLPFSTCPGRKGHYLQKINSSHPPLKQAACMPGSTAQQHSNVLIHYFLKQVAFSFTTQSCS